MAVNFEIFSPVTGTSAPASPTATKVRLNLVQNEDGSVTVCAVRKSGNIRNGGRLITFLPNGMITRETDVGPQLGLHLNPSDQVSIKL